MIFGIFDGRHADHEAVLKETRRYGDHVMAVVAQDHIVQHLLGFLPTANFVERFDKLKTEDAVGEVIIGDADLSAWRIVKQHEPDVVVFSAHQKLLREDLEASLKRLSKKPRIETLLSSEIISPRQ